MFYAENNCAPAEKNRQVRGKMRISILYEEKKINQNHLPVKTRIYIQKSEMTY